MPKILFIVLIAFSFAACTGTTKTAHTSKKTRNYKRPTVETEARTSPATPLINAGISNLKNQENNEAEWKFEEAVNLDPDYGPAYYWLARARYRLEEIEQAINLLDKAKALLKNSEDWLQRIDKFKNFLLEKIN